MKCRTYFWAALSAFAIAFASCDDYDDSAIREEMSGYGERLSSLEEWQKKVDSNLAALQQLIGSQDYITDVKETEEGYVISFVKSEPITLYHGEKGEKGDTGAAGEKGDTGPAGPEGEDGEAFLQGAPVLSEDGSCYVFTLLNGDTFSVAAYRSLRIGEGEDNAVLALTESPQTIALTLPADYDVSCYSALIAQITPEGSDGTYTHIASRAGDVGGWSVEAELPASKEDAEVIVTSPEEGRALLRIALVRTDGSELTSARVLKREKLDYTVETDGSYTVYTATGLKKWADAIAQSTDFAIDCTLEADIDLTGEDWTPICYDQYNDVQAIRLAGYSGVFDGQGHTIKGLKTASLGISAGLFGCVSENGVIKNCNVEGEVSVESPVTLVGGIAGKNSGQVLNCSFKGSISNTNTRSGYLGGVVGYLNKGKVVACRSYVSWNCTKATAGGIVGNGGIVGTSVEACYSRIVAAVGTTTFPGGVIGGMNASQATIAGCYWSRSEGIERPSNGIGAMGNKPTTGEATEVTDGNWTGEPLTKMNETLTSGGYKCRYVENMGEDKEEFPLLVVETVNE